MKSPMVSMAWRMLLKDIAPLTKLVMASRSAEMPMEFPFIQGKMPLERRKA